MKLTALQSHVHYLAGEEIAHQFAERVGLHIDSHATDAEAARLAYLEFFNTEPPEEFLKT